MYIISCGISGISPFNKSSQKICSCEKPLNPTRNINLEKSYLLRNTLNHVPSKTYKDKDGYFRFKDSDIPVHRWVAEKKLGRELRPGEVVHHKDRDKLNNDPDNLWVFSSQEEHDMVHEEDAFLYGEKASYQGFRKIKDDDGDLIDSVFGAEDDDGGDNYDDGDF